MSDSCPKCSKQYDPADVRCPRCGTSFVESIKTGSTILLCPTSDQLKEFVSAELEGRTQPQSIQQHVSTCVDCQRRTNALRVGTGTQLVPGKSPDHRTNPTSVGEYQILGLLGEGAFGAVYRAKRPGASRVVALKVLKQPTYAVRSDPKQWAQLLSLFEKEASALEKLSHPSLVPVLDVGETGDGQRFIASELINGSNLRQFNEKNSVSRDEAVRIIALVARGLGYAHERGFVHRDIKPENILVSTNGRPYVVDFGLVLTDEEYGTYTAQGGTRAYMSPEQARGEGHLADNRSDIFSLGIVLYELITGERPFPKEEVLDNIQFLDPRPLHRKRIDVSPELNRICMKALEKKPSDRYATANELANDLLALGKLDHVRQLNQAAVDWRSNKQARKYLVGSSRLRDWKQSIAKDYTMLAESETEFLSACEAAQTRRRCLLVFAGVLGTIALLSSALVARTKIAKSQFDALISQSHGLVGKQPNSAIQAALDACKLVGADEKQKSIAKKTLREVLSHIGGFRLGHLEGVSCLAVSEDGKCIIAGGRMGICVWDLDKWNPRSPDASFTCAAPAKVLTVAVSDDGNWLASGDVNGAIRLWRRDATTVSPRGTSSFRGASIQQLDFAHHSLVFRTVSEVGCWSLDKKNPLDGEATVLHAGTPLKFVSHPNKKQLAVSLPEGVLSILSFDGQITTLIHDSGTVEDIQFSPNGRWFAVRGGRGVSLFNGNNWKKTNPVLMQRPKAFAFDGKQAIFIADNNGKLSRNELIGDSPHDVPVDVGIAVNSLVVVTPLNDGISRWLLATSFCSLNVKQNDESRRSLPPHAVRPLRILEEPDKIGRRLEGQRADWVGHDCELVALATSNRFLVTADIEGQIRCWDIADSTGAHYPRTLPGRFAATNRNGELGTLQLSPIDTTHVRGDFRVWKTNQLFDESSFLILPESQLWTSEFGRVEQFFSFDDGWVVFDGGRGQVTYIENHGGNIRRLVLTKSSGHELRRCCVSQNGDLFVRRVVTNEDRKTQTRIDGWTYRSVQSAISNGLTLKQTPDYHAEFKGSSLHHLLESSSTGTFLISSGTIAEEIVLYEVGKGDLAEVNRIEKFTRVEATSFSDKDSRVAIGCTDGSVSLHRTPDLNQLDLIAHAKTVTALRLISDDVVEVGDVAGMNISYKFGISEPPSIIDKNVSNAGPLRKIINSKDQRFKVTVDDSGQTLIQMRTLAELKSLAESLK